MILAVDIGNSAIKFGLFERETLTSRFSIPTDRDATDDDIMKAVDGRLPAEIESAVVCSVVPPVENAMRSFLESATGVEPVFVANDFNFGLKINYKPLGSLGTDRLVNAFAAVEKHVKAGDSLQNTLAAKPLKPWSKWAWSFISEDSFTTTLYNGLKS